MNVLYIPISNKRLVKKKRKRESKRRDEKEGREDKIPLSTHYKNEASEGKISTNFVPGRWKRLLDRFRFQPKFSLAKETSEPLQTTTCTCSIIIKDNAKRRITKETAHWKITLLLYNL